MQATLTLPNGDSIRIDLPNNDTNLLGQWLMAIFQGMSNARIPMRYTLEIYP
jgi:hypothetical protein